MPSPTCKVCDSDKESELEALGLEASRGKRSWRSLEPVIKPYGVTRFSLKNHMERHYVSAVEATEAVILDSYEGLVLEAVRDLTDAMKSAAPEVKPLYAVAIRNLQELHNTKPSQQHLVNALKAIQDVTGMKSEQRMMLAFAERMFGAALGDGSVPIPAALIQGDDTDA